MTSSAQARPLQTLVYAVLLTIMIGWLLHLGQGVLTPILVALIAVYILVTAADWLGRLPGLRRWPAWARRTLVLLGFVALVVTLINIIVGTAESVLAAAPRYQANLEQIFTRVTTALELDQEASWRSIRSATVDKLNLQALLGRALGSVGTLLSLTLLVIIYMAFLLGERGRFAHKLAVAMSGAGAQQTQQIIREVNSRIGNYLATKTLINVVLGGLSFAVMWWFGVDFALFWALIIALLNYIPYVGSFLGVCFPVLLTLAQFGSLQTTLTVATLLTVAQLYVGNVLEPRTIGRQVNLSPVVVLVALSLWSSLWGIAGAILAIPLTAMLAIILAAFPGTRPLAILLADDVQVFEEEDRTAAARLQ